LVNKGRQANGIPKKQLKFNAAMAYQPKTFLPLHAHTKGFIYSKTAQSSVFFRYFCRLAFFEKVSNWRLAICTLNALLT
jgi:hypothetical protein